MSDMRCAMCAKGEMMLRQMLALVLCGAVAGTGCASASGTRIAQAPQSTPATQSAQATHATQADNSAIADYAQRLAPGTRVRVEQTDGRSFRGTLMRSTPQAMVVQKNTRVPEAPIEVPLDRVARVTIDSNSGSSVAKNVAIGVGTGVAVTFGIFAILAAIFSYD
jgi:hypothetical protein